MMTEPKRPANVPEGVRWGYVTLGTGERVEAWMNDDESSCLEVLVRDPRGLGPWVWTRRQEFLPFDSEHLTPALSDQCRRLYEAEGAGYVELGEEPEKTSTPGNAREWFDPVANTHVLIFDLPIGRKLHIAATGSGTYSITWPTQADRPSFEEREECEELAVPWLREKWAVMADEPKNTDRTHPDSGAPGIDWEARRWELFFEYAKRAPEELKTSRGFRHWVAEQRKKVDAALAVYREGEE